MTEAFRKWMAYCYPHVADGSPEWKRNKIGFEAGWRAAVKALDETGRSE